jgi:hypothetical protein
MMYTISMDSEGGVFGDRLGFLFFWCFYYFIFLAGCAFAQ